MNYRKHIARAFFVLVALTLPFSAYAETFSDVSPGDYHFLAISSLSAQSTIEGYGDHTFHPDSQITRAEAVKIAIVASKRFSEEEIAAVRENLQEPPFSDTSLDKWYTPYLAAAKEAGIIEGYDDGTFHPDEPLRLAGGLKIYMETLNNTSYPEITHAPFADVPKDAWFTKYFAHAKTQGLLDIPLNNTADPNRLMSRGYFTEIIYRSLKFGEGYEFGKATFYHVGKAHTAAHKTLPFGTRVEVTNLTNGKSVIVTINDRGPYGAGRVLDLSASAFAVISSLSTGVTNVQYKVL